MEANQPSSTLHARALIILFGVSVAIRVLPFRIVADWSIRPRRGRGPNTDIADVRRVVEAWARRLPLRTLCLEQGLCAARLLSRNEAPLALYYGAAMIDGELKAHVWVRSGDLDVIGCENSGDFAILSQFSNAPSSSPVHS